MDSFRDRVEAAVAEHQLLEPAEDVVVGLSGGVDSIVLASLLRDLGHPIRAVHVNYQLRGEASDADEAFVRKWCEERRVDLTTARYDTAQVASKHALSIQHAARKFRYETFVDVARGAGVRCVAVGHQRDDQAETLLLNLFRGTGLEGMAGMRRKRRLLDTDKIVLIRPLLDFSRREIEVYAREHGLDWREDASNIKPEYRRGALRSEILPVIEKHFGESVRSRIARAADLVGAYLSASLSEELREAFDSALEGENESVLWVDALQSLPDVIRRRVIIEAVRRWMPDVEASSKMADEIDNLLSAQPGRRLEWAAGEIWRERKCLRFIAPQFDTESEESAVLGADEEVVLRDGVVRADMVDHPPAQLDAGAPHIAYLDASTVQFPMTVRPWKDGDRFIPLGMDHSKKLSDFLTDERVPSHRKRDVYVVLSEGQIVWVVGHRISHPQRVRSDTTKTIRLSYHPAEH